MSLKHGLLGLLNYGHMTGYELDKSFKDSLYFFWQAQTSQVYRELSAMEKLGWLTSEIVFQTDKPNKKLYIITEEGKKELQLWLSSNNLENEFQTKSVFLMKLFFSADRSVDDTIAMLKEYRQTCLDGLDDMTRAVHNVEQYHETLPTGSNAGLYWGLTARFGEMQMRMCLEFSEESIQILEESR